MPPEDLQQFITLLESRGELVRIHAEVDPLLEIAAITDRVCKQPNAPALLFEHPVNSRFPLATNLFGTLQRSAAALGRDHLGQLTGMVTELLDQVHAPDLQDLDRQIEAVPAFSHYLPQQSPPGWTTHILEPDLLLFPFLQNFPGDGAFCGNPRYLTLPQVFTAEPDGSAPNCGVYRAQLHGPRELAIRWKPGSGAAGHLAAFQKAGKPMPVAIALGGPPAALFSAMFPLPGTLDEMAFAGFLRSAPIGMADCRSVPLQVPSTAELVIEGSVAPGETVMEGPFGNHTGFYAPAGPASLMRISAISHRPDAIIPATVVGAPPMEDCWMAKAWERILLALLRRLIPEVREIHFPLEWIFHQSAVISLEHPRPGMVREIVGRLWDMPWFSASRLLICIDAAGSYEPATVAWHSINLIDYGQDLLFDGTRQRLALDATGGRCLQPKIGRDTVVTQRMQRRWQEYGIPSTV